MRAFFSKYKLVLLHVSFWVVFISYRLFDYTRYLSLKQTFIFFGVPTVFDFAISYVHYFFILPYLFRRRMGQYFALLIPSIAIFMLLRFMADDYFLVPASPDPAYYESIHIARVISVLWGFLSFMTLTSMIKLTANWFDLENKRKQLENEKLTAELNYLKSQINPHFLFNTLHNLNYLALNKSEATSPVIIKLSNIMRYMIYEANKPEVAIAKEVQYMRDYIELERIRLNNEVNVSFDVGPLSDSLKIAPLLLITCLENAFKHGISDSKPDSWVQLKLKYENSTLFYEVKNPILPKRLNNSPSGFGLTNLKKRLHLRYPDKHKLRIESKDDFFEVSLKIDLT